VLLVFIGPPGSGKTTQMNLLSRILIRKGFKARVLCVKRGFLTSIIENLLFKLIYGVKISYPYPLEILLRGSCEKIRVVSQLWFLINTLEITTRILLLHIATKILKYVFLIEDHIPAIIIDYYYISLRLGIPTRRIRSYTSLLAKTYLKAYPYRVLIFDASLKELIKRWNTRGRAEYSYTYLTLTRSLLPFIATWLSINPGETLVFIDTTNKSISETARSVLENVSL